MEQEDFPAEGISTLLLRCQGTALGPTGGQWLEDDNPQEKELLVPSIWRLSGSS